jgi:hypothetical protein
MTDVPGQGPAALPSSLRTGADAVPAEPGQLRWMRPLATRRSHRGVMPTAQLAPL